MYAWLQSTNMKQYKSPGLQYNVKKLTKYTRGFVTLSPVGLRENMV